MGVSIIQYLPTFTSVQGGTGYYFPLIGKADLNPEPSDLKTRKAKILRFYKFEASKF